METGDNATLVSLLRRQFKERKFKCQIMTIDGLDPFLRFFVLPSEKFDEAKQSAVFDPYMILDVRHALQPLPMSAKEPSKKDRHERGRVRRQLERGEIHITLVGGGYMEDIKYNVIDVHFPAWQMDGAKKIQASFGRGIP